MKIDVEFNSTNQRMDANFGQNDNDMNVRFDEIHTLHGKDGLSAYEVAVKNGFEGTEQEWIASLKGRDGYTPVKGKDYFDGEDGYTPVKGKDYFDGEDGYTPVKGKDYFDGEDGQDGFSPVVSVEDIDGGHRVIITDKDGNKTFDVMDGEGGTGGGGASPAIVDVTELPTEDINEDTFYRLLTASFVLNRHVQNKWTCYCVENLPETGEPAFSGDLSDVKSVVVTAYYNVSDGGVYAYVSSMLAGMFGVPSGWYPVAALMQAVGYLFGGTITNIANDPKDGAFRVLLEYVTWCYKDTWVSLKPIGKAGTGANAEIFNHPDNVAIGVNSHAEGYGTNASGDNSHAEGFETNASGYSSHAEGYGTNASGDNSHAEGHGTNASGDNSHAEGHGTNASGDNSHAEGHSSRAEGYVSHAEGSSSHAEGSSSHAEGNSSHAEGNSSHAEGSSSHAEGISSHAEGSSSHAEGNSSHAEGYITHARGRSQHVQGEYNEIDPEYDPEKPYERGKYAHIVGNGNDENARSNAHTLDWNGNAWYQGTVESAGIVLTAPNGTKYKFIVNNDGIFIGTKIK